MGRPQGIVAVHYSPDGGTSWTEITGKPTSDGGLNEDTVTDEMANTQSFAAGTAEPEVRFKDFTDFSALQTDMESNTGYKWAFEDPAGNYYKTVNDDVEFTVHREMSPNQRDGSAKWVLSLESVNDGLALEYDTTL